ncbi:PTS sugar transporter subunit IIA [Streptococcus dentiloxodontae]
MADDFYKVYLDEPLMSRQDVYHFLSRIIGRKNHLSKDLVLESFLIRESLGNIQIADKTVLPHFEMENIQNQVILLRLKDEIDCWLPNIKRIKLVIAIILAKQASLKEKKRITNFVTKLSSDDYIAELLEQSEEKILEGLEV